MTFFFCPLRTLYRNREFWRMQLFWRFEIHRRNNLWIWAAFPKYQMARNRFVSFNESINASNRKCKNWSPVGIMWQFDSFYRGWTETGMDLWKILSDRFLSLTNFIFKMRSMIGNTYLCESAYSTLNFKRSNYRSSLSDTSRLHAMRLQQQMLTLISILLLEKN